MRFDPLATTLLRSYQRHKRVTCGLGNNLNGEAGNLQPVLVAYVSRLRGPQPSKSHTGRRAMCLYSRWWIKGKGILNYILIALQPVLKVLGLLYLEILPHYVWDQKANRFHFWETQFNFSYLQFFGQCDKLHGWWLPSFDKNNYNNSLYKQHTLRKK